ncbi:MAG: hypothetical protein RQ824_00280 [bacterium]|nr:hypothetical protein [bacterium]
MNKKSIILGVLLLFFAVLTYNNFKDSRPRRIEKLTYVTGADVISVKKDISAPPLINKNLFPPEREPFRIANKNIFRPVGFKVKTKKIEPPIAAPAKELLLSPGAIALEIGASAEVNVENAGAALNILISPQDVASGSGTSSPLTFRCEKEGSASAAISDGKRSASLQVDCRMRPEERKLADFIFLGFLAQEKEKTIFLSRIRDNEIFVVKKGDVIIKKGATITQNYVVKGIADDKIIISSADGTDIMEINLTENEPLRK